MSAEGNDFLGALGRWLVDTGPRTERACDLFRGFCAWLVEQGLPLSRASMGLEILHPLVTGRQMIWSAEGVRVQTAQRGIRSENDYDTSPVRLVDETGHSFRRRLDGPQADYGILESLRLAGGTDYVIFPLPFLDQNRTAFVSFTTQAGGGFSDDAIGQLEDAIRAFSPWVERDNLRSAALDLLGTYVGPSTGRRIYEGKVERGQAEFMKAVIMMADLRGYTRYADTHPLSVVLRDLNEWFGLMVSAITGAEGEVLKFTGDGLLAVFPVTEGRVDDALAASVSAARAAVHSVTIANLERGALGDGHFQFGIGVDAGEIAYGNVGSPNRLDFTVIGPTVNRASRLVERSKTLDVPVLLSDAFASQVGPLGLRDLGQHKLRDLGQPRTLYTIA